FNSGTSYELMIVSLLHPAIIIILLSGAAMSAVGREFSTRGFGQWIESRSDVLPALIGKLLPYLLLYFLYAMICLIWLSGWRGYPVHGSLSLLLLGYGLMLLAYALLGAAIVAVSRDVAMALGAAAVYASSALAFSGALFPIRGAPLFSQSWNAVQPYTWYSQISASLWQMGAPDGAVLRPLLILMLMVVVTGAGAWLGLDWAAREKQRGTL
ncbi:MAG: ABC transporter permease, partial [Rhizomicrobium sp.]